MTENNDFETLEHGDDPLGDINYINSNLTNDWSIGLDDEETIKEMLLELAELLEYMISKLEENE